MTANTSNPNPAQPPRSARAFTTPIVGTLANCSRISTAWSYSVDDAHAVKVLFRGDNQTWMFARSLLTDLTCPAGLNGADVQLIPLDDESTLLLLSSPAGQAAVRFDTEDLRQFRNRTYALCLPGDEPAPDLSSVENVLRAAAEHAGGDW